MAAKEMSLSIWIDDVGVNKVAQALCLERSTIRQWRTGTFLPKALHMYAIVRLSQGRVTYKGMIESWAKANGVKARIQGL